MNSPHKNFWQIILAFLLIIAIGLLIWFIVDLRSLYRTGSLRPTRGFNRNYTHRQIINPNQIEGWMTFSYINYIFSLPPSYLKNSLVIQDSHYPNLGIDKYAKEKNINTTSFLTDVQKSVTQYNKSIPQN